MAPDMPIPALRLYIVTFNCGLLPINTEAFASQLFSGLTSSKLPDVLVLSLQEIAPIPQSLIGGSFLIPFFERIYHAVQKGARKVSNATDGPPIYSPVSTRNLGLTGIMVFTKRPEAISDIETASVGVGMAEMGNKGAVGVRFTYQDSGSSTELTFVAAHLAAMESEVRRRNEDWENIVRGLVFSSTTAESKQNARAISDEGLPLLSISPRDASIFKPTSHLFLAGDLNYRTSKLAPAPSDHNDSFPQPYHSPLSPNHFSNLFKDDQLNQERLAGRTCHGLTEAAVTFPPTYKYSIKEPFLTSDEDLAHWNWAQHRWPSWCDRILYLDIPSWLSRVEPQAKLITHKYSALPLQPTSDHRPVSLEVSVPLVPIPSPDDEDGDDPRVNPPFDININWKRQRDRARILEIIVGFSMYFTTTWEGGGVLIAMIAGAVGSYFAFRAMLDV
ncbi:DNase I-like protein [Venustampulla echinocandica]|uniref:DNase I-like protein n=1 Tax=Venustampulla echinocandica TaxID=2656787 RepID=A0A370U197_9HELO|nr:DNase I-like protein [Venustampulla echinocandica]RDL41535.1 DNase I-like protein [Venustampulla echinocandica]